jgi:hypothetical protein
MSDSDSDSEPEDVPKKVVEEVVEEVAPKAPAKDSYDVLTGKIRKCDKILEQMRNKLNVREGLDIDPDDKEFRAYVRKKESYVAMLSKTREYKEKKLQAGLEFLHQTFESQSDISLDGTASSTVDGSDASEKPDYKTTLKKYDKAGLILEELIEDFGEEECWDRKDFRKYERKQKGYLEDLADFPEWKSEKRFRDEQAPRLEKIKKKAADIVEKEKQKTIAIAKEAQKKELDAAIADALTKLRAKRETMEQTDKMYEVADNMACDVEEDPMKEAKKFEAEMAQRAKDFSKQLADQEEMGMNFLDSPKKAKKGKVKIGKKGKTQKPTLTL